MFTEQWLGEWKGEMGCASPLAKLGVQALEAQELQAEVEAQGFLAVLALADLGYVGLVEVPPQGVVAALAIQVLEAQAGLSPKGGVPLQ